MTIIELLRFNQPNIRVILHFEYREHLLSLLIFIIKIFRFPKRLHLIRTCVLYSRARKRFSTTSTGIRAADDRVKLIDDYMSLEVGDQFLEDSGSVVVLDPL